MFLKNPAALDKPWILSRPDDENKVSIPVEVTRHLANYHIMGVEFLYHNYRKGVKGSVLNEEPKMNLPLQLSAFFRAVAGGPALILVLCSRQSSCFWHYHLVNHAKFDVIRVSSKNCTETFGGDAKLALIVTNDSLKLLEDLVDHDFFSVVIEDLDQFAVKRVIKRLSGGFNVGLTHRSFYTDPDQKLQWSMLNWANPGCVGKLGNFYEIDNRNLENFEDNYRFWWLRLTWQFCESFQEPSDEDMEIYKKTVSDWASANSLTFHSEDKPKTRKRRAPKAEPEDLSDSSDKTIINEVPMDKYVELPKLDETPILTSIIKNLETSPEPILTRVAPHNKKLLPCTLTSYEDEKSVIFSFLEDEATPSTSRSASEDFIINLIQKPESTEAESSKIADILKEADALLQN